MATSILQQYTKIHWEKIITNVNLINNSKSKNYNELILKTFNNNIRSSLFMLQAIFRVLAKSKYTNDNIEKYYNEFKLLEDKYGEIDFHLSIKSELTKQKNSTKQNLEQVAKSITQTCGEITKFLKDNG